MRERLLVLALALGALAVFYVLLFPKPQPEPEGLVLPLSSESRPDGYLAVWRWLEEQRIPAVGLRYRYDRLPELLSQSTGNLLVMSMPQRVPARAAELADLERWVDRGNTLLIMAALYDQPIWAIGGDPLLTTRLERVTGLSFTPAPRSVSDLRSLIKDRVAIRSRGEHALLVGVKSITALSPLPARQWSVRTGGDAIALELATREDTQDPAIWLRGRGAGQIIVIAVGSPFSNAAVTLADNARLLANIIAWSRAPSGAVVFDDAHQGATAYYDGKVFFGDPRLHRSLGWIVLLWFAFVLGSQPLRAMQQPWRPLDEATYVEASARYFAAVVRPCDAAKRLIDDFLDEMRGRLKLDRDASAWQSLDADIAVLPADRTALHDHYTDACAGERVDLVHLQNLLARLRRNLQ